MKERAGIGVGFSHMQMSAALSILALIGVLAFQVYNYMRPSAEKAEGSVSAVSEGIKSIDWQTPLSDATSSPLDPNGISNIDANVSDALLNSYQALVDSDLYTSEEGARIASEIGTSLKASISYKTYAESDIEKSDDTSYGAMITYRTELGKALEPLLQNKGYEFSFLANYIDTGDASYLAKLRASAKNYRLALEQASRVGVPKDALEEHVAILNALSEYTSTIENMSDHASDAFATAALVRTYNTSEEKLMSSFDKLAVYYRSKKP